MWSRYSWAKKSMKEMKWHTKCIYKYGATIDSIMSKLKIFRIWTLDTIISKLFSKKKTNSKINNEVFRWFIICFGCGRIIGSWLPCKSTICSNYRRTILTILIMSLLSPMDRLLNLYRNLYVADIFLLIHIILALFFHFFQIHPGNIIVPIDALLPQIAAVPNPNLGILLSELLNLIGSHLLRLVPLEIVNAPLNILALQDYLTPTLAILPSGSPVTLSQFVRLLAQFLAQELSYNLLWLLEGEIYY